MPEQDDLYETLVDFLFLCERIRLLPKGSHLTYWEVIPGHKPIIYEGKPAITATTGSIRNECRRALEERVARNER